MSRNTALIQRLFEALRDHDHESMAACYAADATFTDIAFSLSGREAIGSMWHMIAKTDLVLIDHQVAFADEARAEARWQARYTFNFDAPLIGPQANPVTNDTTSQFVLRDGLIQSQTDRSDAWAWSRQAMGPVFGLIVVLLPSIRRKVAAKKLADFSARQTG